MDYVSSEGLKKLKQELEDRKTKNRKEIAQQLMDAKALGDLSENTEYSSAKDAQAFNEKRIQELEEIIKNSTSVKPRNNKQQVQTGSVIDVKVMNPGGSSERTFTIVGPQEADPSEGKISYEAPIGQAFLGRGLNDIIEVDTPKGKAKYKIMEIK